MSLARIRMPRRRRIGLGILLASVSFLVGRRGLGSRVLSSYPIGVPGIGPSHNQTIATCT
jgi:hypothetical protein